MSTLYLMCGFSRAGKTTRAKEIERETGAFRISADEWRMRLRFSNAGDPDELGLEYAAFLLRHGFDVVYDNLNLTERERRYALLHFPEDTRKICVFMDTDAETLRHRGGAYFRGKLQEPTREESFDEIWRIRWTKP